MSATRTSTTARKSWMSRLADWSGVRTPGHNLSRTRSYGFRPSLEHLGSRDLMSGVTATLTSGGVLAVTGTDGMDLIAVRQIDNRITVDGVAGSFDAGQVTGVYVDAKGESDFVCLYALLGQQPLRCPAVIEAGAGDDSVLVGDGTTEIDGGDGNDVVVGGTGFDLVFGGAGNDTIVGNPGGVFGYTLGSGNDPNVLVGGDGDDTIQGSLSRDYIFGSAGQDTLDGVSGDDVISGGTGHDVLKGNLGNDLLLGDEGNDALFGGSGVDVLSGGSGVDRLYGEGGTDVLLYDWYDRNYGVVSDSSETYAGSDTATNLQAAIQVQATLATKTPDPLVEQYLANDRKLSMQDLQDGGFDTMGFTTKYGGYIPPAIF